MDLNEFQTAASETDKTGANYDNEPKKDVVVALLGIAGELGTLATTYKKHLRDGAGYELHKQHLAEELGDLLWYVAILANKFDLKLAEIADQNLKKTKGFWGEPVPRAIARDESNKECERFPRVFTIEVKEIERDGKIKAVMSLDGCPLGDPLTDNAHVPDGYRFHDAFHMTFVALLGWSPVLRKLMKLKRRSNAVLDENEDGGRAIVIEEALAALIFEYGMDHDQMKSTPRVDYEFTQTLMLISRRLDIKDVSAAEWSNVISEGWKIFRNLTEWGGGYVECNLKERSIIARPPT
ncbi:nucleoside triphosphate pyrophosphohydrolase family protein [Xanthomonas arboricola]|uniref:Nucleotide pyrophosphohydrolase n=1 Tax=Xanthomonas arboricola TaxID=56448 RepID=A0AAU9HM74_9XANT|nr:nucleoside triphosphate pyrophosphohydrolase family protein [Xanthomonas arboricola]CAE6686918.1 hypothetical protein XA1314C_00710 [Xanthomonas arboricola]CAE6686934.1 hypothetical protein XA1314C_00710 [Xanthomonas arboricola]